jgi:hypothetical protein
LHIFSEIRPHKGSRGGRGGRERQPEREGEGIFSLSVYSSFCDVFGAGKRGECGKNRENHGKIAIKKPPRIF